MSGIYIHGIEKSKTCVFCRFCDGIADTQLGACAYCVVDGKAREADIPPKDCPLIPVPDHGRLIDGDAMVESLADLLKFPSNLVNGQWIVNTIREQPTIIPADKEGET